MKHKTLLLTAGRLAIVPAFFFLLLIEFSCENNELPMRNELQENKMTKLGQKLANPYSVKNMKKAWENVKVKNSAGRLKGDEVDIRTTHYYVRFLPPDYTLYDTLTLDSVLWLVDHPIDQEIAEQGDFYHDPSIPDSLPTYQYTAIPIDYEVADGIGVEIIEALYLPEEDTLLANEGGRMSDATRQLIEELEDEALRITNNLSESVNGRTNSSTYHPQGFVKVRDTRLGIIPLEGAKIRTQRWFEVHEAITDVNGHYYVEGTYRHDFNYNLIWERDKFDVRSGTYGQATLDGPNQKSDWNVTIDGGVQNFYASVFRGAHRYFYKNLGGLKRPGLWSKTKICAYDKNSGGSNGDCWGNMFSGWLPDIRIWRSVDGRERGTDEIFSTTVHEIAHVSHIELMNAGEIQFEQVSKTIRESWAVGVQWQVTSMEYREKGIANYANEWWDSGILRYRMNFGYQNWSRENFPAHPEYTSLFIDLVDNFNQFGAFPNALIDNVTGYTFAGIESGYLKKVYGVESLREKLKANKPSGVTDSRIDQLLNQF